MSDELKWARSCVAYMETEMLRLKNEVSQLQEDKARLDFLEREMEREKHSILAGTYFSLPLFRRNLPITRDTIDRARQEGST